MNENKEELLREAVRRYPKGVTIKGHPHGDGTNFTSTGEFILSGLSVMCKINDQRFNNRLVKLSGCDWQPIVKSTSSKNWTPEQRAKYMANRQNKRNLQKAERLFAKGTKVIGFNSKVFISIGNIFQDDRGNISALFVQTPDGIRIRYTIFDNSVKAWAKVVKNEANMTKPTYTQMIGRHKREHSEILKPNNEFYKITPTIEKKVLALLIILSAILMAIAVIGCSILYLENMD